MEGQMKVRFTGTRPLLMSNSRLANPLDPYTQAIAAISKKRNKTLEDRLEIAQLEARGGMYETEEGLLGIPNQNIWRCIYDAAKGFKLGADVQRALIPNLGVAPITVDGSHVKADQYLTDSDDHLLYVSVTVQRARTMRARPIIPTGWTVETTFDIFTDILEESKLRPVLARAGRVVGLGDWRPRYGTFEAEIV